MQMLDLAERDFAGREQGQEVFTAKEFVFAFTLHCQRIEADQHVIHAAGMTHHDTGRADSRVAHSSGVSMVRAAG